MNCVLVWSDKRTGGTIICSTAYGIHARLHRPRGWPTRRPDALSLAQAELRIGRAVLQASHVSALVRVTENALLCEACAQDDLGFGLGA